VYSFAVANIFENERIRKWTIIGAVLGGIAPIATLSENQSLTIPDILLGALTIGSIFGFVAFGINKSNDAQRLRTSSKKRNNQSAQIANMTNHPKFKVAAVAGFLILGLAYLTNTRSELSDRSMLAVLSSPTPGVVGPASYTCRDHDSNILTYDMTKCGAYNGWWVREDSYFTRYPKDATAVWELVKQDLSDNQQFVVVGVGVVGLLIYLTRKSGSRNP
jgi:hypothetical protein